MEVWSESLDGFLDTKCSAALILGTVCLWKVQESC